MSNDELSSLTTYLTFKLDNETYAANVSKVLNILEISKITKVPKSPDYMKGVINLRGTVLPLIDTRIKFGLTETMYTTNTCILVLDITISEELVQIGALVDGVSEVLKIESNQIFSPPKMGSKYHSEFISGMYKAEDEQFIMILDMDKVFSNEEFIDVHTNAKSI